MTCSLHRVLLCIAETDTNSMGSAPYINFNHAEAGRMDSQRPTSCHIEKSVLLPVCLPGCLHLAQTLARGEVSVLISN